MQCIHFTSLTTLLSGIFITVASIMLARVKPFSKFKI